jgi:hypothetical protein
MIGNKVNRNPDSELNSRFKHNRYYSPIFSKTKKQIISLSQNSFFSKISKEGLYIPF